MSAGETIRKFGPAVAASTLASVLATGAAGHGEVPTIDWTTQETKVSSSGYDLTPYTRANTGDPGRDFCLRTMTVEENRVTTEHEHELPYVLPILVPLPGLPWRRREDSETNTSQAGAAVDEYSHFQDPARAKAIIEHVGSAPAKTRPGTAAGGNGARGEQVRPTGSYRSKEVSFARGGKVILGLAAASIVGIGAFQYHQSEFDSIICKDAGSWGTSFCFPEIGNNDAQPNPMPSTSPSNGVMPTPSPEALLSTPSLKEDSPSEGYVGTPSPVVDPCAGLETYTDVTLIQTQNGQDPSIS